MSRAQLILPIEGMSCGGCVRSVRTALEAITGVHAVEVSLELGRAEVELDPELTSRTALVGAIEGAGFDVPGG